MVIVIVMVGMENEFMGEFWTYNFGLYFHDLRFYDKTLEKFSYSAEF